MTLPVLRNPSPARLFLGLPLQNPGIDGLIDWLTLPAPEERAPAAAAYLNAHTTNLALRPGSSLYLAYRQMNMLYPDGMSVVREARRRGIPIRERVSAGDFFPRFCWAAAARGRTLALIGGEAGLAEACAREMTRNVPGLNIILTHHGFFGERDRRRLARRLHQLRPAVTLLGMGTPAQEQFALHLRDRCQLPALWCVGALFEYYTPGVRKHAPLWMREAGLEWLFRLGQEPRRLGKRYLLGNGEFLLRTRLLAPRDQKTR